MVDRWKIRKVYCIAEYTTSLSTTVAQEKQFISDSYQERKRKGEGNTYTVYYHAKI